MCNSRHQLLLQDQNARKLICAAYAADTVTTAFSTLVEVLTRTVIKPYSSVVIASCWVQTTKLEHNG